MRWMLKLYFSSHSHSILQQAYSSFPSTQPSIFSDLGSGELSKNIFVSHFATCLGIISLWIFIDHLTSFDIWHRKLPIFPAIYFINIRKRSTQFNLSRRQLLGVFEQPILTVRLHWVLILKSFISWSGRLKQWNVCKLQQIVAGSLFQCETIDV